MNNSPISGIYTDFVFFKAYELNEELRRKVFYILPILGIKNTLIYSNYRKKIAKNYCKENMCWRIDRLYNIVSYGSHNYYLSQDCNSKFINLEELINLLNRNINNINYNELLNILEYRVNIFDIKYNISDIISANN